MCYKLTAVVLDPDTRNKFIMIKEENVVSELRRLFASDVLPPHLGGTASRYGPAHLE